MAPAEVSAVLCSPWATPDDVPATTRQSLGLTDDQLQGALLRASEMLWALTGRRWYGGGCTETARLVSRPTPGAPYSPSWGTCGCWDAPAGTWQRHVDEPAVIRLPRSPITAVTSIVEDGVTLPPSAYVAGRSGWVERVDGLRWRVCAADTVITYTHGEPPPAGGRDAAVTLGVEFARDQYGLEGCRLPKRVTSLTRQGVTMSMIDPQDYLDQGLTGLVTVDLWIKAVNPDGRPEGGMVLLFDSPQTRKAFP